MAEHLKNQYTTKNTYMDDGGYFAIKGFEYQIDKSILEVLSCNDMERDIYIEQIQDINTESFVMQIKYKEAAKLVPSSIKKPIIQLIEEHQKHPNKEYILYCYFSDTNGYSSEVDIVLLDNILGKASCNYSTQIKDEFLTKFKLIFSKTFHDQFQLVLHKLQEFEFCNSKDEAVYYYSVVTDFLRKKITNNPHDQVAERKVNKKEISVYLANGRKIVFTSAFKEYKGEEAYFTLIKRKFKKPIKNQKVIIILGNIMQVSTTTISSLVYQIIDKHYYKALVDIQPLTFVIPDNDVRQVKEHLIHKEKLYNDGFEPIKFSPSIFFNSPIINKDVINKRATDSLGKSSFYCRIISTSTFNSLTSIKDNFSWIFFDSEKHSLVQGDYQIINGLNTEQILKLF